MGNAAFISGSHAFFQRTALDRSAQPFVPARQFTDIPVLLEKIQTAAARPASGTIIERDEVEKGRHSASFALCQAFVCEGAW